MPAGRDPLETALHLSEALEGMDECKLLLRKFRPRREQPPSSSLLLDQDGFVGSGSCITLVLCRVRILLCHPGKLLLEAQAKTSAGAEVAPVLQAEWQGFLATDSRWTRALGEEVMQRLQRLLNLRKKLHKPVHGRAKEAFR